MQNVRGIPSDELDLDYFVALNERKFIYSIGRIRWNLRNKHSPRTKALLEKITPILQATLKAFLQDFAERYRALK